MFRYPGFSEGVTKLCRKLWNDILGAFAPTFSRKIANHFEKLSPPVEATMRSGTIPRCRFRNGRACRTKIWYYFSIWLMFSSRGLKPETGRCGFTSGPF